MRNFYTKDRSSGSSKLRYFTTSKLSENISETPEGYLVCVGVSIARTGEMEYGEGETPLEVDAKGVVKIQRDESEVFRPETIASFEGKALTITHPEEFVSPQNWARLAKGIIQNVRRGEGDQKDDLIADILVTDAIAIALVKKGLREVSCGYEAMYEQTAEGKGIQTSIVGNHLALVEEGRAGPQYAINDQRKGTKMKISEKIKAIFAKAQDEALKIADEETAPPKEEKKEEKSKDAAAYDELVKMMKDMSSKIESMGKPADKKPEEKPAEEKPAADADPMAALSDRVAALEASLQKFLEAQGGTGDEEAEGEEDESEDDDFEETTATGDTKSRAEILSPGIKMTKDVKKLALKACYATKDGKQIIDMLSSGKGIEDAKVDQLFVSTSEMLKISRTKDLAATKQVGETGDSPLSLKPVTAEDMNELNAKFYAKK